MFTAYKITTLQYWVFEYTIQYSTKAKYIFNQDVNRLKALMGYPVNVGLSYALMLAHCICLCLSYYFGLSLVDAVIVSLLTYFWH